jgi:hypothetical protein
MYVGRENICFLRLQILMVVCIKVMLFQDMILCSFVGGYQHFVGNCGLCLQGIFLEATGYSELLLPVCLTSLRLILEYRNLDT